ncbi:MAG: ABC transporter permease subunit [Actinomycetota bacterium]|nr:ABC transporter permease subunit [Actinomycetota bacterium]
MEIVDKLTAWSEEGGITCREILDSEKRDSNKDKTKQKYNGIPRFHIIGICSVVSFLIIWTAITELRIVESLYLPSPSDIYIRFLEEKSTILSDYLNTFFRMTVGFIIGSSAGIIVALIMGRSRVAAAFANPIIQLLKPVPPLALAPFAMLWWGTGVEGAFFLVIYGCFFITGGGWCASYKKYPKIYHWAGASLGATKNNIFTRAVLPCMFPSIIGGLRVCLVTAFNLVILAEFNMASGGLGNIIIKGYRFLITDLPQY